MRLGTGIEFEGFVGKFVFLPSVDSAVDIDSFGGFVGVLLASLIVAHVADLQSEIVVVLDVGIVFPVGVVGSFVLGATKFFIVSVAKAQIFTRFTSKNHAKRSLQKIV